MDLWQYLSSSNKKIVMYGMGNGGDKILGVCERYGIEISDFFASDGFVRGHSFHDKTVISYSAMKEKYAGQNPIVLLSFASSLPEVITNIKKIATEVELYAPDVPVFGDNLFNMEFFTSHRAEFEKAYEREIIEKMVLGRIQKYYKEVCLVDQEFVKDPDQTVGKLVAAAGAAVTEFTRFQLGEGIEKKQEDFAAEVMAQIK